MLHNKRVIVTGAASGIGRACAKRLLSQGNSVVAVDVNRDQMGAELGDENANLIFAAGDVA